MNKEIFILFLLLIFSLGACSEEQGESLQEEGTIETTVDYTTNDFTPPTGKADGPDDFNAWNSRLLFATSSDGLTWTRTNQLIADQTNVPSAVVKDGRIFVYHVTWAEEIRNKIAVAISDDNGESWVFKKVVIKDAQGNPTDPYIVLLEDGRFRLYFTTQIPRNPDIEAFSAVSNDGITFTLEEGTRISAAEEGANVVNVKVMQVGDTLHLYGLNEYGPDGLYHATSLDGITFTKQDTIEENMILSSGIAQDDGLRSYGFKHTGNNDVKALELKLLSSEDYKLLSTSNYVYIGDLDRDDTESEDFDVYVNEGQTEVSIPIQLSYEVNKHDYKEESTLVLNLLTVEEAKKVGLIKSNSTFSIILVVIILIVAYLIYRRLRKR